VIAARPLSYVNGASPRRGSPILLCDQQGRQGSNCDLWFWRSAGRGTIEYRSGFPDPLTSRYVRDGRGRMKRLAKLLVLGVAVYAVAEPLVRHVTILATQSLLLPSLFPASRLERAGSASCAAMISSAAWRLPAPRVPEPPLRGRPTRVDDGRVVAGRACRR